MSDLKTQLREYLDETAPPVEYEEVLRGVEVGPTGPTGWFTFRTPGWLYAVAAAAAVLIIGGLVWLIAPDPGVDPADTVVSNDTTVPATLAESAPATVVSPSGEVEVTWTQAQDGVGGPVVAISSVLLRIDGNSSGLSRSSDGENWEPILTELTGISVAADGRLAVVAGLRRDGTTALLRSSDGENWTEVDHYALAHDGHFTVVMTTSNGFAWLRFGNPEGRGRGGDGVLARIDGDRIVEVHNLPKGTDENLNDSRSLVEVGGNMVVVQSSGITDDSHLSYAWSYLGNGLWSDPVEIAYSSDHARVGDTILMFDQTNATCCANPIRGTSDWPLLASQDGINWTQIATRSADNVHSLELESGNSFWVYGSQTGGGSRGIELRPEYDASTTVWISADGSTWEVLDLSFLDYSYSTSTYGTVQVRGDFIYVSDESSYWIGKVEIR